MMNHRIGVLIRNMATLNNEVLLIKLYLEVHIQQFSDLLIKYFCLEDLHIFSMHFPEAVCQFKLDFTDAFPH